MDEVAKESQLAIAGRGDHAYITTFPGKPLDHGYDLNVTDICPVGALTGKHFRFQQRVWMLKSVESIDPSDSLGANITIEYNVGQENGKVWRLMPRRNPSVNKSWLANSSRMLYKELAVNRLTDGLIKGADAVLGDAVAAAENALAGARKIAVVTSGHLTTEDNAALLALADKFGARAEVFGGSWLHVGPADGIARSGDPVANRKALQLLGVPDNLDALVARSGEFDVLLVVGHDLWGNDASKALKLDGIATRIVLSAWSNASTAKATIAIGIRAWAEVRGTMVNCQGRVQLLNACPVVPNQDLEPAWQVVSRLAGLGWVSESEAWRAAVARVPQFAGITYRTVGPQGQALVQTVVEAAVPAAVGA
jgi:NADH-quinone oxidoreductase subunit G